MKKRRFNTCKPLATKTDHRNLFPTLYVDVDVGRSGPRVSPESYLEILEMKEEKPLPVVFNPDQAVLAATQWGSSRPPDKFWVRSWYYPLDAFDPWPSKAPEGVKCWWCLYPFDTPPFPMPYHFSPKHDRFKVRGMFCGPSCAKAYACKSSATGSNAVGWIDIIAKKHFGFPKGCRIPAAPPREILRDFCGSKGFTIEQFRTACMYSRSIRILPPRMITEKQVVEAEQNNAKAQNSMAYHVENPDRMQTTREMVSQARTPYIGKGVKRLNDFFFQKKHHRALP